MLFGSISEKPHIRHLSSTVGIQENYKYEMKTKHTAVWSHLQDCGWTALGQATSTKLWLPEENHLGDSNTYRMEIFFFSCSWCSGLLNAEHIYCFICNAAGQFQEEIQADSRRAPSSTEKNKRVVCSTIQSFLTSMLWFIPWYQVLLSLSESKENRHNYSRLSCQLW